MEQALVSHDRLPANLLRPVLALVSAPNRDFGCSVLDFSRRFSKREPTRPVFRVRHSEKSNLFDASREFYEAMASLSLLLPTRVDFAIRIASESDVDDFVPLLIGSVVPDLAIVLPVVWQSDGFTSTDTTEPPGGPEVLAEVVKSCRRLQTTLEPTLWTPGRNETPEIVTKSGGLIPPEYASQLLRPHATAIRDAMVENVCRKFRRTGLSVESLDPPEIGSNQDLQLGQS